MDRWKHLNTHFKTNIKTFALKDGGTDYTEKDSSRITTLLSEIKTGMTQKARRSEVLLSLSSDYATWTTSNTKIAKTNDEILGIRKKLNRLKKIEEELSAIADAQTASERRYDDSNKELNYLSNIKDAIPKYLEVIKKISVHEASLMTETASITELQKQLAVLTTELAFIERRYSESTRKLKDAGAAQVLIDNELLNSGKRVARLTDIDAESKTLREKITHDEELLHKLKALLPVVTNNFAGATTALFKELVGTMPHLNPSLFEDAAREWSTLQEKSKNLNQINAEIRDHETKLKFYKETLTKAHALLASALEFVPQNSAEVNCPVCEVKHRSNDLRNLISSKLKLNENNEVQKINSEITAKLIRRGEVEREKSAASEKYEQLQSRILLNISSDSKVLETQVAMNSNRLGEIEREKSGIVLSQAQLMHEINGKLGTENASLSVCADLCAKTISSLQQSTLKDKGDIEGGKTKKTDLTAKIELSQSKQVATKETLQLLKTDTSYSHVVSYILTKSSPEADVTNEISHKIRSLTEAINLLRKTATSVESSREKLLDEKKKLSHPVSVSELENKVLLLEANAQEIDRFLANYKDKCMVVGLRLDEVTKEKLKSEQSAVKVELASEEKKTQLLESVLKRGQNLIVFNKDAALRNSERKLTAEVSELNKHIEAATAALKKTNELEEHFSAAIEQHVEDNLDNVFLNEIYNALNPHQKFKKITLDVKKKRNNVGILLSAKDARTAARPEFLFSSGQLNTLGVSIFLAMALRQSWLGLDTVLIDDPIQNLDDINVLSFIDLIRGLLDAEAGKQVIMSTHDARFYDLIKHKFADYRIKAYRFNSYGSVMPDPVLPVLKAS